MWFCIFCPLISPFSQYCQCSIDKNRCDSEPIKFVLNIYAVFVFYSFQMGTERVVFEGLVTRRWRLSQSWLTSDSVVGHEWLSRGRRLTRSSTHCFSVVCKACLFRTAVGMVLWIFIRFSLLVCSVCRSACPSNRLCRFARRSNRLCRLACPRTPNFQLSTLNFQLAMAFYEKKGPFSWGGQGTCYICSR